MDQIKMTKEEIKLLTKKLVLFRLFSFIIPLIPSLVFVTIFLISKDDNGSIINITSMLILLGSVAVFPIFYFKLYYPVIKNYRKDLSNGMKNVVIGTIQKKEIIRGNNVITVNDLLYYVNDSEYLKLNLGDSVQIEESQFSKVVLNIMKK